MNGRVFLIAVTGAMFLAASSPPKPLPPQPVQGQVLTPGSMHRAAFVEGVERFYREVDIKGRGYFKASDLTLPGYHIAHPPVPYPQAQAEAPFRCVDANGDGRISQQEYVTYAVRAFDATAWNGLMDPPALRQAISFDRGCKKS